MPEAKFFSYKNSRLCYYLFGKGKQTVICFHGYGEDGTSFEFLEKFAGDQFCFLALDLPFHGKTEWKEKEITNDDLVQIITQVLKLQTSNIKPPYRAGRPQTPTLQLLGFSLGGRIALSLYQQFPLEVDRMVLLAPDGLKINFWYWLSTQTVLGNRLFSFTMKNPEWFFGFLKILNFFRLVNKSIFKFVNYYIGNAEIRTQLYQRWTSLSKLRPDLGKIKKSVEKNNTQVRLIYGKHDRIILPNAGQRFCKDIENSCRISMIHSGHQVLHENHIAEILPALND